MRRRHIPPSPIVDAVTSHLQECGSGTRADIAKAIGRDTARIGSVLFRMNRPGVNMPKRIYVIDWVYDGEDDARLYPRAVYALGSEPDKPKPKPASNALNARRHRARQKGRVNSVFALAQRKFLPQMVKV